MEKIWDLNTWKQIYSFNLHQGSVMKAKFHPNEPNLVTSNTDKIVRYWSLEKFNLVKAFLCILAYLIFY